MLTSGKPNLIRQFNRDLILDLIQTKGPVTKSELARLSGASVPTVNKIVNQMEAEGLVCSTNEGNSAVGRKAVSYVINKDAGYFIVFFIQNGIITAGLADSHEEFVRMESIRPDMDSQDKVMAAIFNTADSFIAEIPAEKLRAIGFGVPGVIDPENRIIAIPTVPGWEGISLASLMEEKYKVPVFLENDVKLMTVGLYKQKYSRQYRNMVFLYVSEGIGAGIVNNGHLYKGFHNFAGEYGFMLPDFENTSIHPEWTGDLEFKLRPIAEKMIHNPPLDETSYQLYLKILSGIITNFTAVLNPDLIAICAPDLTEKDLEQIRQLTLERIPDSCMPDLSLSREEDYGINGVVELCMTEISTRISLIDKKGL